MRTKAEARRLAKLWRELRMLSAKLRGALPSALPIPEAAKRANLTERYLRERIAAGDVLMVEVGGRRLVPVSELEQFSPTASLKRLFPLPGERRATR